MTDYELILSSALRYALGRRTYIVSVVTNYIENEIPNLSEHCIKVMIRDIENPYCDDYGYDCDKRDWMRLLGKLKEAVSDK